jgi:trafficking protein particle complex subunit 8
VKNKIYTDIILQDILPLLLMPSPTIPLHASTALTSIHSNSTEVYPHAQVRALLCAVRWEAGISSQDFISDILEGERWLVWAAGNVRDHLLSYTSCLLLLSFWIEGRRSAVCFVIGASCTFECEKASKKESCIMVCFCSGKVREMRNCKSLFLPSS